MSSPAGFLLVATLSLPIASCGTAAMNAARKLVASSADDVANGARRAVAKASGLADDAARGAAKGAPSVSRGAWARLSSSVDDAVATSGRVNQALAAASARMSPKAFALLRQKHEKNEAALQIEIDRANSGYRSDAECAQAAVRIEKLTREQAAIEKLISEMG
jgi:hypothetical protein